MKVRFTETVSRGMRRVLSQQRRTATLRVGGIAVSRFLKRYYRTKDAAEPNALGGDRTHFWKQIGNSVSEVPEIVKGNVSIPIRDPRFPQKLFGGPIVPRKAKALTIPIHPAAHGRTAAQIGAKVGGLFILRTKSGGAFLAGKIGTVLTLYFVLLRRVIQRPWPGTLPPNRSMKWVFTHAIRQYLRDLFRKEAK